MSMSEGNDWMKEMGDFYNYMFALASGASSAKMLLWRPRHRGSMSEGNDWMKEMGDFYNYMFALASGASSAKMLLWRPRHRGEKKKESESVSPCALRGVPTDEDEDEFQDQMRELDRYLGRGEKKKESESVSPCALRGVPTDEDEDEFQDQMRELDRYLGDIEADHVSQGTYSRQCLRKLRRYYRRLQVIRRACKSQARRRLSRKQPRPAAFRGQVTPKVLKQDQREANYKQFKKIREEKGTKKTRRMTAIQAAWRLCWGAGAFQSLLACQIMVKFPPGSRIYKHAKSILQSGAQQLRSSQERNRTQIAEVKPC
eukprot:s6518_g2.t1